MHPSNRSNGFAEGAICADAPTTPTNKSSTNLIGTSVARIICARSYHFVVAALRAKEAESARVKYWETIADNLSKGRVECGLGLSRRLQRANAMSTPRDCSAVPIGLGTRRIVGVNPREWAATNTLVP